MRCPRQAIGPHPSVRILKRSDYRKLKEATQKGASFIYSGGILIGLS